VTDAILLPGGAILRPLETLDAPALHDAFERNREHLRRFDPRRPDSFWTLEGQQQRLDQLLREQRAGTTLPMAMLRSGRIVGCATLNTIVRGALCSADVGYWVDVDEQRQGLASATVAALCRLADEELGLHRLAASTSPQNPTSQRVLAKNGFEQFGHARDYLYINGQWEDSLLFQRILNDRPAPASPSIAARQ
jgi:ribosomal-protein-alanine N-acetyltransferase